MNRTVLLVSTVLLLLVGNIAYRVWKGWGLITIHATDAPLSEVIRQVEKKGSVTIRTNMDPAKKISLHVVRAPLAYVLEVLGNVSDSRLQLAYYFGPDSGTIETALSAAASGQRPEGWKSWQLELRGMGPGDDEGTSDPRTDTWQVKAEPEGTLHAYLEQGSKNVSARFNAPEAWNPAVKSAPGAGQVRKVAPKLAKNAHGKAVEVFFLAGRPAQTPDATAAEGGERRGGVRGLFGDSGFRGPGGPGGDGTPPDPNDPEVSKRRQAMEERAQAEIAKIKDAAERARALAEYQQRKADMEEMRKATPEERAAKMEARMSNPETQNRMEAGMAKRDAMKTPEQRVDRYRSYNERKTKATSSPQ